MPLKEPSFTVGIEEEYLLVDRSSRDLIQERPDGLMEELEERLQGQVVPEFLNSQVEIGTRVGATVKEAADDLKRLRSTVATAAEKHGLAIIAASTHPFAAWAEQTHTDKERYHVLARDLQGVARRLLICGMHVHVGIEDPDLRIDLLSQISYFLPHLLVLSSSSPFWRGENTGLMSYRIAVFDELPRTGVPETFDSWGEYERHVDMLVNAGLVEDASKLWWDIRPSCKFPTLEMRLCDIPTRVSDTICIAAFFTCLLRMLYRLRRSNQRWRRYRAMLVSENRWRAQRYGIDEGLVDFGRGEIVAYDELLEELIELVEPDAAVLGCGDQLAHARKILARGTSAHRQVATWQAAVDGGATGTDAFIPVVDMLIEETVADL